MKTIVTMISSLIMGALMANSSFSPLQELGHLLANKRRFIYALGFYSAGFVFLMTGIITGAIEGTLQYEAQGFVFWSAMSTLALSFALLGVLSIIVGRLTLPSFLPQSASYSALGPQTDWAELLEGAVKMFSELSRPAPPASQPTHQAETPDPVQNTTPPVTDPRYAVESELTH